MDVEPPLAANAAVVARQVGVTTLFALSCSRQRGPTVPQRLGAAPENYRASRASAEAQNHHFSNTSHMS
jgi:hypothetical protein